MPITLKENDLTVSSLLKFRVVTVLGLIGMPLISLIYWNLEHLPKWSILVLTALSFIGMICFVVSFFNRKFAAAFLTTKVTDEWWAEKKLRAEAFGYQISLITFLVVFLGLVQLFDGAGDGRNLTMDATDMVLVMLSIMSALIMVPALYLAWTLKPLSGED